MLWRELKAHIYLKALRDSAYVLAGLSLFPNGLTLPQRGVTHVNKTDIELKARKITKTFVIESTYDLALLPMEV